MATGIVVAMAGVVAMAPAAVRTEPSTVPADIHLTAASTPPGGLLEQFLANQGQNCAQICPHIVDLAVRPAIAFAVIPVTFTQQLAAGVPLLQAIAKTDATVSGAANEAMTGIITNDLGLVLPRAQNALEVAVVGLTDGNPAAARDNLYAALRAPLGTHPPATAHNALEVAEVRAIEVTSGITFQAPERLLLGATQTADSFFRTVGDTGDVAKGLGAAGTTAGRAVHDSAGLVRKSISVHIPRSKVRAVTPSVRKIAAALGKPRHRLVKKAD